MMVSHAVNLNEDCQITLGDKRDFDGKSKSSIFTDYKAIIYCHDAFDNKDSKIKADSHGNRIFNIAADTSHCGAYSYTLKRVWIHDIFSFFSFPKRCNITRVLLVRPIPTKPDTIPDIEGTMSKTLRKSKSQYSEIYDLRDYMSGDSVKNIHWKMSAKKDSVLVKEPLEEESGNARLYFELASSRAEMDKKLGEILFMSNFFLSKGIHHQISVMGKGREISFGIITSEDIDTMIDELLKIELPTDTDASKTRGGDL